MIKPLIALSIASLFVTPTFADVKAMAFYYQEKETGTPVSNMRYLITEDYMRIDEGNESDDFILFDTFENKIYSINHEDQTALEIDYHPWKLPNFGFSRKVVNSKMTEAPKVSGKFIQRYQVFGNEKLCTDVQYIPDVYPEQMKVFAKYQRVLSGQQVVVLDATPSDMQTACFLVDQVYNDGGFYKKGLPVQIWHSRGYARMLIDFKEETVKENLFELPGEYRTYKAFVQ